MNSVSPVRTFTGLPSSTTSQEMLSGVCPGVSIARNSMSPMREDVAVANGAMRELRTGRRADHDLRAGALRKLAMAAHEIGVKMRLDDVPDLQSAPVRLGDVLIDVALRIDDRRFAVRSR